MCWRSAVYNDVGYSWFAYRSTATKLVQRLVMDLAGPIVLLLAALDPTSLRSRYGGSSFFSFHSRSSKPLLRGGGYCSWATSSAVAVRHGALSHDPSAVHVLLGCLGDKSSSKVHVFSRHPSETHLFEFALSQLVKFTIPHKGISIDDTILMFRPIEKVHETRSNPVFVRFIANQPIQLFRGLHQMCLASHLTMVFIVQLRRYGPQSLV